MSKMKQLRNFVLVFIFTVLLFLGFQSRSTFAQTTGYAQVYQTYVDKQGVYQTAHSAYLTARSTYLASMSLDAKDKAMTATLKMLQARDDLTAAYLNAIKSKIDTVQGMTSGDKSSAKGQIDTEIAWYNAHNSKLSSAGTLDDLISDSDEAKNRFNNVTKVVVYESLITISTGNNSFMRGELSSEITTLNAKIAEIKANQDKNTSTIERTMVDIQNKLDRSQAKDDDAKNTMNSINVSTQNIDGDFSTAQTLVSDSLSYLKEANQSLLQVITQIKTAD